MPPFIRDVAIRVGLKRGRDLAGALLVLVALQGGAMSGAEPAAGLGGISNAQIRDVVERVARHQLRALRDGAYPEVTNLTQAKAAERPEGIQWNYPWGVALYGMERSTEVTSDAAVENFVAQHNLICSRYYEWLAGLERRFGQEGKSFGRRTALKGLVSLGNLDSCGAMGTEFLASLMRHRGPVAPQEEVVLRRISDWVQHQQDRLPDGTLWRARQAGGTVWPDDLYMGGVFLVWWGHYTGEQKCVDDAARNIIAQAALEQDADGLWYHGYFMKEKTHAPFKWGRGNGWAMVATVEALSAMPQDDELRPKLLSLLHKQVEGLRKVQCADGMWRQVLDKPELWEETSCTAMFASGIARAVNRGWLPPADALMARKAFAALSQRVTEDGSVNGTCQGTNIGRTLDYYINRQRPNNDPHGPGPVMLAGTEILLGEKP